MRTGFLVLIVPVPGHCISLTMQVFCIRPKQTIYVVPITCMTKKIGKFFFFLNIKHVHEPHLGFFFLKSQKMFRVGGKKLG